MYIRNEVMVNWDGSHIKDKDIDLDETVFRRLISTWWFSNSFIEGSKNNWAHGHDIYGPQYEESILEKIRHDYGPIVNIDLKLPPRSLGYCFIEFEDAHDEEDAIRGLDGYDVDGHSLRVKLAHGGRGISSSDDCYDSLSSDGGIRDLPRHFDYRVIIIDLKDRIRQDLSAYIKASWHGIVLDDGSLTFRLEKSPRYSMGRKFLKNKWGAVFKSRGNQ
eukprot:Gb_25726 [translate_table: standard]